MKLYFTPGVCSLAPHIALREAGIDVQLEKVDDSNRAAYRSVNPHGYVPALEIRPGLVLTEGPAIMQYIADLAPQARLAPENGSIDRYRLQSWLNFITTELHKSFTPLFKPGMPAEAKTQFKDLIGQRLDYVEQRLAQHAYLLDSGFSIADAYLFVVTGWAGFVGLSLDRWPHIVAFRKRIGARPAVQAAMRAEGLQPPAGDA
ncbi:MAG TPA: glutathione transferase GstA [Noviherbaspirillum sp.]|jgi:glutathione S-transferase|uniref:glutathione transferase GstA n=1 Tax=Noviherbaspirillum sp. TaxID=1926288 RepID=UPI002F933B53